MRNDTRFEKQLELTILHSQTPCELWLKTISVFN